MKGYATLTHKELVTALEVAIEWGTKAAREWRAVDKLNKEEEINQIWAKRTWYFGPWTYKGAENRYHSSLGMFGHTNASMKAFQREKLVEKWKDLLAATGKYNAEPYLMAFEDYKLLMGWQREEDVDG